MSSFWIAAMVVAVVGISWGAVLQIVKMGTRHSENMARIKHGYPTIDGKTKHSDVVVEADYIDMTDGNGPRQQ